MRRALIPALWAAALAVQLAAPPARAAFFEDDEARQRIEQLRGRIDRLEGSVQERLRTLEDTVKGQGLVDLLRDVEQLKSDLAKLRGQYEVLAYELEQAQKRQRDLYLDLDGRLRKLESAAPAAGAPGAPADNAQLPGSPSGPGGTPPAGAAPPVGLAPPAGTAPPPGARGALASAADVVVEQRTYDAALDQFKSGNYAAAVTSFQTFARANPKSALAPSALYWAGNAQFALRDYRAAIATQRQMIATYPDSQKVPDALLNMASCYSELRDNAGARRALEEIVAKYPGSEAAGKARTRLSGR
ncbi:MAG TPA: tol-pal system protein YbgF [Casimicrobiaceae bacterium]|nr:tol-pal system protein YbgF [Casimicrobiaceae bacterium]